MTKKLLTVSAVAIGTAVLVTGLTLRPQLAFTAPAPALAPAVTAAPNGGVLPDFVSLVDRYGPAVVNIDVRGTVKTRSRRDDSDDEDSSPFAPFFRGMPNGPQAQPMRGEGSGFIVRSDGVILTNAHVVADADQVTVKLTDRREFSAKVIGVDKRTDVAVIKIDAKNLPIVSVGDDADLKVGQWVVAIGSPFGFENSVTQGIVSAKARSLGPEDSSVPFIQTDVAVNPGNSGGPLFDLQGRVVGINSQIYSRSGGFQGLSFAIPISLAMNIEDQLLTHGKAEHARLGVGVQTLDQKLATAFGLSSPNGALIGKVEDESAAAKAGIKAGDVVQTLNGKPVADSGQFAAAIAAQRPGAKVELGIWRDRSAKTMSVVLGADDSAQVATADRQEAKQGQLGLTVRPLTQQEKSQSGLRSGLVVEDVDGAAADAGIEPGDVVVGANGREIKTIQDLKTAVKGSNNAVALLVQHGDAQIYVPVPVG
jgi:serine protease Do